MPNFICMTCGTQYAESHQPPAVCTICEDERQYVKKTGQQWTTLDKLRLTYRNSLKFKEPGLIGIGIERAGRPVISVARPTATRAGGRGAHRRRARYRSGKYRR